MNTRRILWLAALLSSACVSAQAEPPAGYKLAWSDEFNGPALDTNKWFYRTGQRLLSFQKPENVSITNGLLRLALKREDTGKAHFTAGGVISRQTFKYGYYEARFRCPRSAGWHTSFWTMEYHQPGEKADGVDFAQQVAGGSGAVQAQEIDICEQDSANNRSYSAGVIDWSQKSGKKSVSFGRERFRSPPDPVPDFAADFHTWGCEFTPTQVRFFLDGKLTHQTDATKFPHAEQNVWLTCVGALWGEPVKPKQIDDTALPAYSEFDWVRVYTKAADPEAGSTVEKKVRPQAYVHDPALPNVLLVGDSISMGYLQPVRELLKGKANVVRPVSAKNTPENCEGTTAGVKNLERWLGATKWAVIHFNFGLHDLKRVKSPGDSQVSTSYNDPRQADLATYEANLEKIVTCLEQTGARLVFATTTPVPPGVGFVARSPEDVPQYNAAALRVMAKHHVPVNDLYQFCLPQLDQIQKKKNVHFTDEGFRALAGEVARAVAAQLGHTAAEKDAGPDYLKQVRLYAEALLQHGRNQHGTNFGSLIVTCMDLKDFSHMRRDDAQLAMLNDAGYRSKDTLFRAADPHLDENFYQILYALSRVTGEVRYAQEADRMLTEFFRAAQNPRTGLFAWGEHMGLDFDNGQVQNPLWLRGGRWAERFEGRPIHEFYRPWVLWPQSFRLDEPRCLKFARGLWDFQIYEHTGDFSRHAGWDAPNPDPPTGAHFPRHAGFYIATWAQAYKVSGDKTFVRAIQTQLDFFDRIRDPERHFVPANGSGEKVPEDKSYWPGSNLSLVIDLCQSSGLVPTELGARMREFARRELELYLELTSEARAVAGWKSGYGDVSEAGTGVCLFMAAEACPDERLSQRLVARGLLRARAYLEGEPDAAKWLTPGGLGQVILLMSEASHRTGEQRFLAKADWYAAYAAANFLNGTPLPRALRGANFYHAITRGDTLMLALLKLWELEHQPELRLKLEYTDR